MSRPAVDFNLYVISDRLHLPEGKDLLGQLEQALLGGVRCVQLREKDLSAEELLPVAIELRLMTSAFNARLIINDKVDLARTVAADGVHLGGQSMTVTEARRHLGPGKLIGVSTHTPEEVDRAASQGADFVTFGPVYPTPSKLPYGQPLGLDPLRMVCARHALPIFALGGVTSERLDALRHAGCHHVACIGAILHADNPVVSSRQFIAALHRGHDVPVC
ncbi:MAG: thiamine phosphate synthase [Desulfuromonadaceae bacterium]|nr:thiamine phosphate synthase [Desulfuromonadaceae bacterium]